MIQSEGIKSILFVTSSFHMPRAELLFRQQGIELETFPVDFLDWVIESIATLPQYCWL